MLLVLEARLPVFMPVLGAVLRVLPMLLRPCSLLLRRVLQWLLQREGRRLPICRALVLPLLPLLLGRIAPARAVAAGAAAGMGREAWCRRLIAAVVRVRRSSWVLPQRRLPMQVVAALGSTALRCGAAGLPAGAGAPALGCRCARRDEPAAAAAAAGPGTTSPDAAFIEIVAKWLTATAMAAAAAAAPSPALLLCPERLREGGRSTYPPSSRTAAARANAATAATNGPAGRAACRLRSPTCSSSLLLRGACRCRRASGLLLVAALCFGGLRLRGALAAGLFAGRLWLRAALRLQLGKKCVSPPDRLANMLPAAVFVSIEKQFRY